jgi:hypothetical protein
VSHPFIERLIGAVRREYLDRLFFWNSADLTRKLAALRDYYNEFRVHRSLGGMTPARHAGAASPPPAAQYLRMATALPRSVADSGRSLTYQQFATHTYLILDRRSDSNRIHGPWHRDAAPSSRRAVGTNRIQRTAQPKRCISVMATVSAASRSVPDCSTRSRVMTRCTTRSSGVSNSGRVTAEGVEVKRQTESRCA